MRDNPLYLTASEKQLGSRNNKLNRTEIFASPSGALGRAQIALKDALIKGHMDRLLFIDYTKLCDDTIAQIKRIYDFLEIKFYNHNFENIQQEIAYNSDIMNLPNLHSVKNKLEKNSYNSKQILGDTIYNQYTSEFTNDGVFWDSLT